MSATGPLWSNENYLRIVIRNFRTEARVGMYGWEQHDDKPQRLLITVELFAHQPAPHHSRSLESVIDYGYIPRALKAWPSRPHTPLLENLAEDLLVICFQDPKVEAARVSILKPDIVNEADAAGVEVYRKRPS